MNPAQFRKWLATNYGRKQPREAFLRDFNAIAQALGEESILWPTVSHWMYDRQPPENIGSITFERALEMILERRQNPDATTCAYTVVLFVNDDTGKTIERRAWMAGVAPEEWLRATLETMLAKLPK
jgi:hypothetical protein